MGGPFGSPHTPPVVGSRSFMPLALLLAYGAGFASWALGLSLIGFDDHPGQLYRVWHVVTRGPAPWAWNPGWWGGYPELQFYPPGFPYAVALVHVATCKTLSVAASYQAFVWLAYLAPAVTAWLLLRRVLRDGWLALPGAFVALTLSAGLASGVEGGVHWGMVPARLAWALLPLLTLSLVGWISGERGFPWTVVPLVAAVVITHPAHLPAAVVLVVVAAWLARSRRRPRPFAYAATALGLAAGLSAFWTVPLLAHVEHVRALAWGSLLASEVFGHPLAVVVIALAAFDLWTRFRHRGGQRDASAMLLTFAWAMAAVVLVDRFVIEPLGIRWLPADRVADSAWLAFVLSAGATGGRLLVTLTRDRARARVAVALATVAVTIALALPARTLTLWPPLVGWERYATIERGLRLDALWARLRAAPPGRVLFVRSGVPLVYGSQWWRPHSHITALTPLVTGREIVNGTFTHPSPVAALIYRGDAGPGAISELVERLDGGRLFGRDLDGLDPDTYNRYADGLGVSTVVALDEDVPHLRALRDNPRFTRAPDSPPFVIYTRREPVALPRVVGPSHLRLPIDSTRASWLPARISYYPLWRATADGRSIATRRAEMGDLEVQSPRPAAEIDLDYARGPAETIGLAITALSLAAFPLIVLLGKRQNYGGEAGAAHTTAPAQKTEAAAQEGQHRVGDRKRLT
jgi:hypothetical protein